MDGARFAGAHLLALASLDLEEGQSFRFPIFATDPGPTLGQNIWSDFTVMGKESITVGEVEYDAWIVNNDPWTLWVSKEPPYIIKREALGRTWLLRTVRTTE